jgi:hypothetical protein
MARDNDVIPAVQHETIPFNMLKLVTFYENDMLAFLRWSPDIQLELTMQDRLTGLKEALRPQLVGESTWNRLNSRPADRPSRLAPPTSNLTKMCLSLILHISPWNLNFVINRGVAQNSLKDFI